MKPGSEVMRMVEEGIVERAVPKAYREGGAVIRPAKESAMKRIVVKEGVMIEAERAAIRKRIAVESSEVPVVSVRAIALGIPVFGVIIVVVVIMGDLYVLLHDARLGAIPLLMRRSHLRITSRKPYQQDHCHSRGQQRAHRATWFRERLHRTTVLVEKDWRFLMRGVRALLAT